MHHDDYNAHNLMTALRARRLMRNDEFIPNMRLQLDRLEQKRWLKRVSIKIVVCVTLGMAAFIYGVGYLAVSDAKQDQATYCSMVRQKLWPDFRHIYKTDCRANPH